MLAGLEQGKISSGDVIVIRYEGPKGGPGMPEMLTPTSALAGAGLAGSVALVTDAETSPRVHLDLSLENDRGERPLQGTAVVELPLRGN